MAGVVYGREARQGSYVEAGDLIANVGRMDQLRVRVYVDEPELGRVAVGQPVTITWDALPGRQWQGQVERKPSAIQALGSRQVGEVLCSIDNQGRALVPGTNVNAEIRTAVVDNALVIPKETLRHDAQGDYVYVLKGDTIERRAVKKGISSITQVQVVEGLERWRCGGAARRRAAQARRPRNCRDVEHGELIMPTSMSPAGGAELRVVSGTEPLSLVRAERRQHGLDVRHHGPAALQPGAQAGDHANCSAPGASQRDRWIEQAG